MYFHIYEQKVKLSHIAKISLCIPKFPRKEPPASQLFPTMIRGNLKEGDFNFFGTVFRAGKLSTLQVLLISFTMVTVGVCKIGASPENSNSKCLLKTRHSSYLYPKIGESTVSDTKGWLKCESQAFWGYSIASCCVVFHQVRKSHYKSHWCVASRGKFRANEVRKPEG